MPIVAGVPFGMGFAEILQSLTAYLIDTYTMYAASAIAATVVLRSTMAFAFPLFCPAMFARLGDKWAMNVFAFLSLACTPIPFLFWVRIMENVIHASFLTYFQKYGKYIREKSKFAVRDEQVSEKSMSSASSTIETKAKRLDEKSGA